MKIQLPASAVARPLSDAEVFPPAEYFASRENSAVGSAPTILELDGIKVTSQEYPLFFQDYLRKITPDPETKDFYRCISATCKSWLCPRCRQVKGFALREKLISKAPMFKIPRLYTITVNREWFEDPKAAYDHVMKEKFIARLLTKEFKIRRWIWVLEAQEESGDGWPHWHILIDVADLPGAWYHAESKTNSDSAPDARNGWRYIPHFFDLNRVHRLLRKWKIGEQCYLSVRHSNFDNPAHAINYITKYLVKTPKRGFPVWMLKSPGIRFYQPSKEIGTMGENFGAAKKEWEIDSKSRLCRPPIDRVAECGLKVVYATYDAQGDKVRLSPAVWGLKKALPLFPGAVVQKDFDFIRQKEFDTWGFDDLGTLQGFTDLWNKGQGLELVLAEVNQRKAEMLTRWDAPANVEPQRKERSGSFCPSGLGAAVAPSSTRWTARC
jgi:hypothetical protein